MLRMTAALRTRNAKLRSTAALQTRNAVMRTNTANRTRNVPRTTTRSLEVKMIANTHLTTFLNVFLTTLNPQEDKRNLRRSVNKSKT